MLNDRKHHGKTFLALLTPFHKQMKRVCIVMPCHCCCNKNSEITFIFKNSMNTVGRCICNSMHKTVSILSNQICDSLAWTITLQTRFKQLTICHQYRIRKLVFFPNKIKIKFPFCYLQLYALKNLFYYKFLRNQYINLIHIVQSQHLEESKQSYLTCYAIT